MKKKVFLFSIVAFLFSGVAFSQTGKDSTATATKAKKEKAMPKSCPGKSCGKKKPA